MQKKYWNLIALYDYFQAGVLVIDLDELRKITTSKKDDSISCIKIVSLP